MQPKPKPPLPSDWHNRVVLTGLARVHDALRYTPAGVAVLEFALEHVSRQSAGGFERDVRCLVQALLVGPLATELATSLNARTVTVQGFLAARSLRNPKLVLHIQHVEFEKGI